MSGTVRELSAVETHNPLVPATYDLVWGVLVVLLLAAVVVAIVLVVRRVGRAPRSAEGTLEQRLAELDDLRGRGVISDEEHRAARAEALRP